jgi:hypothetical protein
MVTIMEAGITATGVGMREEAGIGIITRMVVMRIVATTVGQIGLGEVGVVGVVAASLLLL